MSEQAFISRREMARYLSISISTLNRHSTTGILAQYVRIGRRVLYPISLLDEIRLQVACPSQPEECPNERTKHIGDSQQRPNPAENPGAFNE
jgi:hypothetical protein